ncbi:MULTISPECIES: ADP-ribosylglycohydrolase family protein [unclassified Nitrosospira]|uniref:ADP-ribosylglycohydrolase family protein n=1 Tax=unclassified Nitrosospira TaxID=2609267 RepID=UPI000D327042|nr:MULTISPECIES: ADP-ribosylglycohydrolase family protein [unclassified Nitrosospira]PTR16855.1 ADP-ribosylglycohydrolase [Nitrosospira sp. Nsp2]WON74751.1 ADP-ribosylglycohydrolase family protein [Nitrosospira sp. Is2]
MSDPAIQDRAAGAIMGAIIGDALGLGPHWYYDLSALRRDYGDWITTYTDPKPGRYHSNLKAGQLSQTGILLRLMLRSLIERDGYDEADFCRRMDEEILPLLNGLPVNGPGGYTQQSIRDAWRKRVQQNLPWGQTGGQADTTEAIGRTLALAVRYALQPEELASTISSNTRLTQIDDTVVTLTVAYGAVLGLLVQGHKLNRSLSGKLMRLARAGKLPFHSMAHTDLEPPKEDRPPESGHFVSPDALLTPSYVAAAALDPDIRIEPAWKVSIVYGMTCAIYHQLPAAYYLTARFPNDFESAVLHAVNSGGENQARATLTGALVGAQVGLSGIPPRFLDGLEEGETLQRFAMELASKVGALTAGRDS